jgi:diguanylate cyclase (GGDEF)-like protein/PAS domain S-box-containing protein
VRYRARHAKGHWVWIEALARRVPAADGGAEVVYAGRDISGRVRAEQALAASQARLRAVADNVPAIISHIDSQERYTFINSLGHQVFATDEASVIGRTVREVRGEEIYRQIGGHVADALAGKRVTFDGQSTVHGKRFHYQTSYVPDVGEDGVQRGFFAFTYDITQLKDAEQALEQLARFDAMTGLANRRYFDERLSATVARCRRQGAPLALLYLDIDQFKRINDGHGHAVGDEVLKLFAARLKSCVREGDLAARIGGDEFVLLAEGTASLQDAQAVAHKLLALISEPMPVSVGTLHLHASIGIAFSARCARGEKLLVAADSALYEAKGAGRNTSRWVELE